jgi:hypothetical protein
MKIGEISYAIICVCAIGVVAYLLIVANMESNHVDPTENRTITIIDKYDGQNLIVDQNENHYFVPTLQEYIKLHPQKTYEVVVGTRTDKTMFPFSTSEYKYIKEIVGEVK